VADVAAGLPAADLSVRIAKSYVGERAVPIVRGCVQMHGGVGVT
jgi:alkylation response protein AidB-like acyl-CoA dehydrogenase